MNFPTYLPFTVVAGCVATIVAVVVGVTRALKRAEEAEITNGGTKPTSIGRIFDAIGVVWGGLMLAL
jgi:hypothetical protein